MKPIVERQQGICDYKPPNTKKELQRFLGMINYDRMFIKNITEKISPLYKLLEKDTKFCWDNNHQEAFEQIKNEWSKNLEIVIPDMTADFSLEADASNVGLGAVLRQNEMPVAYISRSLCKAEKNYSITEKEVLASLWAMEKLKFYLHGKKFKLISDHKPIEVIRKKAEFGSPRLVRWLERLEKFDFECVYRKGSEVVVADALSRSSPSLKEGEEDDKINAIIPCEGDEQILRDRILKVHVDYDHRKNILNECFIANIKINKNKLRNVLKQCKTCKEMDKKIGKSCKYIQSFSPGESRY